MYKLKKFQDFKRIDESLTTKDAKSAIKDIFKKFDGKVTDKYLKNIWEEDSTFRNLYTKDLFDKAWDELIDEGEIKTEDGKTWCWCDMVKENVNEGKEISKEDEEKYLSPKQRKLPEPLKKAIINRAKKSKSKKKEEK